HTQILVIGCGPAGSYAASALAREGFDVTVFESAKFPRYHIGESLIPSVRHYLRFIGAEGKLASYGFTHKPGSAIKFNQYKREGYTDFVALGLSNSAWNVVRSEFDHLLMNHSRACGAKVYEQTRVNTISFAASNPEQPISVCWTHVPQPPPLSPPASPIKSRFEWPPSPQDVVPQPTQGVTTFDYIVDASGRAGLFSNTYLKNRHFNTSLKNIAVWGYWRNVGKYGVGTSREGAPWFEALIDESGWAWFIPLHNGTTSIGIVMNKKVYDEKVKGNPLPSAPSHFMASNTSESSMVAHYLNNLSLAPGLLKLITEYGVMKEGSVKSASDFSYSALSYAGNRFRIIGDAGAFIDPFFSSGVHLAFTSALSAAATICASIRGHCLEATAASWHTQRVATSYTRKVYIVAFLSAYKQIRSQTDDILSDIDEDNYDRAFTFLRPGIFKKFCSIFYHIKTEIMPPVIQGASDMGTRLSEWELQKSLDFCVNLFNPTSPEQHERLLRAGKIYQGLLDVASPIIDPATFERTLRVEIVTSAQTAADLKTEKISEMKLVLHKVNARRVVHAEYAIHNLESERIDGFVVKLERGKLGLAKYERNWRVETEWCSNRDDTV
ncbi:FAD binding domain-containing protein, partial [Cyathus striatus]